MSLGESSDPLSSCLPCLAGESGQPGVVGYPKCEDEGSWVQECCCPWGRGGYPST